MVNADVGHRFAHPARIAVALGCRTHALRDIIGRFAIKTTWPSALFPSHLNVLEDDVSARQAMRSDQQNTLIRFIRILNPSSVLFLSFVLMSWCVWNYRVLSVMALRYAQRTWPAVGTMRAVRPWQNVPCAPECVRPSSESSYVSTGRNRNTEIIELNNWYSRRIFLESANVLSNDTFSRQTSETEKSSYSSGKGSSKEILVLGRRSLSRDLKPGPPEARTTTSGWWQQWSIDARGPRFGPGKSRFVHVSRGPSQNESCTSEAES